MRCCILDIETTDLSAVGSGFILCAAIKPLGGKTKVFRYDEMRCKPGLEKPLVNALLQDLSNYHLWIGHNIISFDYNFVKSRASLLGIRMTPRPYLYDTMLAFRRCGYLTARNIVGKPKASLDHVVDFLEIPQKKTKVGYPVEHWKTVWLTGKGRRDAMDKLVDHVVRDVEMTEQVYLKLIDADTLGRIERYR